MTRFCDQCGAEIVEGAVFCQKCGHRIDADQSVPQTDSEPQLAAEDDAAPAPDTGHENADPEEYLAEKIRASGGGKTTTTKDEKQLWEGGYSGKAMLGNWLVAALVVIIVSVITFYFFSTSTGLYTTLIMLVIAFGVVAFQLIYRKLNVHYVVTNQRLIHRLGVMRRVTDRIEMIDIDDVTFEQGLVQRMVGVGNIKVISSDRTHPILWLKGIADVQRIAALIDDTRRDERRRRGLHIEQI